MYLKNIKYMASNPLHRKSILNFITELPVLSDQMEVEKVMLEMLSAGYLVNRAPNSFEAVTCRTLFFQEQRIESH